jgi:hypothetical protein
VFGCGDGGAGFGVAPRSQCVVGMGRRDAEYGSRNNYKDLQSSPLFEGYRHLTRSYTTDHIFLFWTLLAYEIHQRSNSH